MELVHLNFITSVHLKWELGTQLAELTMSHSNMKRLIHSDSDSFDLIMIEAFCQEYTVAIGHKYNAPVINLAPAMVWPSITKWLHVPSTFSYIPDSCSTSPADMSFVERLKNTVTGVMQLYVENYVYLPKMKEIMNKHFTYKGWESRPPLEHMLNNVSLTLANSHYAIGIPRPYLPGIVEVGGLHIKQPKSLPEVLNQWVCFRINCLNTVHRYFDSFNNSFSRRFYCSDILRLNKFKNFVSYQYIFNVAYVLKNGKKCYEINVLFYIYVNIIITNSGQHHRYELLYFIYKHITLIVSMILE